MKFAFNPVQAYREHGQRYSIYVAIQLAVTVGLIIVGAITLTGSFIDLYTTDPIYQFGLVVLKLVCVGAIYIAFEYLYWKVRLHNLRLAKQHRQP